MRRLWVRWCDGFWLCVWFAIAFGLAFSLPGAALRWFTKTTGEGPLNGVVRLAGALFAVLASPVIVSKVFRHLDDPGAPPPGTQDRGVAP